MSTFGDDPFRKRDPATPQTGAEGAPQQDPWAGGPGYPPPGSPAGSAAGYPPPGSPAGSAAGYPPPGSVPPGYPPPPQYPGYPGYGYPPGGQPGWNAGTGQPPSNLGWAIVAVIFFWPLAIAAFINYAKIDSLWYRGDVQGARAASDATKRYGIIALCVGIGLIVLWLVFAIAVVGTTASTSG